MNPQEGGADMARLSWRELLFLLRSCDSLFPTGGYSHSFGMEELVRMGWVRDERSLIEFLRRQVLGAVGAVELPLAVHARRAVRAEDWGVVKELNELAGAVRAARELREASLRTGRRRLAALAASVRVEEVQRLWELAEADEGFGHAAVVWGGVCARMDERGMAAALVYQTLAVYCGAAPKLLRIGQEGVQRAMSAALEVAGEVIERGLAVKVEEIGFFDPVVDVASMKHEVAFERLFIS